MNSFLLRILFSGLITFMPSQDGKEVTVVLMNVDHSYHTSDGAALDAHKPLLLARAGSCTGDCVQRDTNIAQYIYEDKSVSEANDALEDAVTGGTAWSLAGSDLSLRKGNANAADLPALSFVTNARATVNGVPAPIPTTAAEREDYSWVANLKSLCSGCAINPDVFGSNPPAGVVAARFTLKSGKLFTYAIARTGTNVGAVHFQKLDGTGAVSPYSQAVASWVGADIEIDGSDIEIVDSKLDGSAGRSVKLAPDANGKVEIAVLNIPPFVPPASAGPFTPQVGKHFEHYYDVSENPPAAETRLVPFAGPASTLAAYDDVDWQLIHPTDALYSELLNKLRLNTGRSMYDRNLCPPSNDPRP